MLSQSIYCSGRQLTCRARWASRCGGGRRGSWRWCVGRKLSHRETRRLRSRLPRTFDLTPHQPSRRRPAIAQDCPSLSFIGQEHEEIVSEAQWRSDSFASSTRSTPSTLASSCLPQHPQRKLFRRHSEIHDLHQHKMDGIKIKAKARVCSHACGTLQSFTSTMWSSRHPSS